MQTNKKNWILCKFVFVRSLVAACSQGDIGRVRRLLDEVNHVVYFDWFCTSDKSWIILYFCNLFLNNWQINQFQGRVSVHETTEDGESLLSLACSAGYYELAQVRLFFFPVIFFLVRIIFLRDFGALFFIPVRQLKIAQKWPLQLHWSGTCSEESW